MRPDAPDAPSDPLDVLTDALTPSDVLDATPSPAPAPGTLPGDEPDPAASDPAHEPLGLGAKILAVPLAPFVAAWEGGRALFTDVIPSVVVAVGGALAAVWRPISDVLLRQRVAQVLELDQFAHAAVLRARDLHRLHGCRVA